MGESVLITDEFLLECDAARALYHDVVLWAANLFSVVAKAHIAIEAGTLPADYEIIPHEVRATRRGAGWGGMPLCPRVWISARSPAARSTARIPRR